MNILYQPYLYHGKMREGPFKYIESGYLDGFKKNGCDVAVWDGRDLEHLDNLLSGFRPDIFVGYLRGSGDYQNFPWVSGPSFERLKDYRLRTGMKVALHAHPNVQELVKHLRLDFVENDPSNAGKFYSQPPPPTPEERNLVDEAFIDVILHPYSSEVTRTLFCVLVVQRNPRS